MNKQKVKIVIKRILDGTASSEEKDFINEYLLSSFEDEPWDEKNFGDRDKLEKSILYAVESKTTCPEVKIQPRRKTFVWLKIAGLFFLFGTIAFYLFKYKSVQIGGTNRFAENVQLSPAQSQAIMQLDDGQRKMLDANSPNKETNFGNLSIKISPSGIFSYKANEHSQGVESNTLSIPKGAKFQLLLEDGTKVWLNSESSITFPDYFSKNERKIRISGEAYLEVAKMENRPFYVEMDKSEVKVLGTKFIVNTYANHYSYPSVSLLEGSVQLNNERQTALLNPGEKAEIISDKILLKSFDQEAEMAWVNNYFIYKNSNIKKIMTDLGRWYDAEISYEGKNWENKNFTIRVSRRKEITEILRLLELTKTVKFEITGRRIKVKEI